MPAFSPSHPTSLLRAPICSSGLLTALPIACFGDIAARPGCGSTALRSARLLHFLSMFFDILVLLPFNTHPSAQYSIIWYIPLKKRFERASHSTARCCPCSPRVTRLRADSSLGSHFSHAQRAASGSQWRRGSGARPSGHRTRLRWHAGGRHARSHPRSCASNHNVNAAPAFAASTRLCTSPSAAAISTSAKCTWRPGQPLKLPARRACMPTCSMRVRWQLKRSTRSFSIFSQQPHAPPRRCAQGPR